MRAASSGLFDQSLFYHILWLNSLPDQYIVRPVIRLILLSPLFIEESARLIETGAGGKGFYEQV